MYSSVAARLPVARWRVWRVPAAALAALALCNLILLAPAPPLLQTWAALGLLALLPGALGVHALIGRQADAPGPAERLVYSVGVGYGLLVLILLGLSYLPGGLSFGQVLLVFDLAVLLLILTTFPTAQQTTPGSTVLPPLVLSWSLVSLAGLMLGAAYLRFTHLGYSELHGDEALVALRAVDVIQGWERALFVHKKGPGEILLGTGLYVLTGRLSEFAAHLPFALASWAGVLATYLLGRRWFGPVAGWWAGAMVAVDGYLMAFGRMLQYQSVVFLMVVLTVLAMQAALDRRQAPIRYLLLAAFCLATGLLAHYEAAVAVPPALWLLSCLWRSQEGTWRTATGRLARQMVAPLLLGALILGAFYVPFVLDPEFFRDTYAYIFGHRLAGSTAPEGFAIWVGRSTLYSSSYYVWTLVGLTLVGLLWGYHLTLPGWLRIPMTLLLAAVMALLLVDATAFFQTSGRLALLMLAVVFAPVWLAPRVPQAERTAWIWFGAPLLGVTFFVMKPGTHVYIIFIPWALVAGMVVGRIWAAVARRWGPQGVRWAVAPVLVLLVLLFGNYVRWLFLVNEVEVLRTWDENRPPGYWTSYATPEFESIFGFPIRNGWKTVAALYAQGELAGRFDTNDRFSMVPDWYVRGEEYCPRDAPNYYLLVPYPLPVDRPLVDEKRRQLADKYYLWGTVTSNDQPHMEIYARTDRVTAGQAGAPRILREEDYTDLFDDRLLAPFTRNGPLGTQPVPTPVRYYFGGEAIHLLGYSVDRHQVAPGGELEVVLYWTATAPLDTNYYVSIQVIDLETTGKAGQRDGEPGCNRFPTTTWVPGDRLFDRYHVPIEPDAQPGDYTLYVTLYEMSDGVQSGLPVTDDAGQPVAGAALTTITVKQE